MARHRVVIVDRPAWYLPIVEAEELARADAEVLVGWARLGASPELDPTMASLGLPVEQLSLISLSYVGSARHTEDVIAEMAHDADAIVVTSARVTAGAMDRLPRLRVIGRPGIGYDVVDVEAATARGIAVFSAPGFCAREVADHTLMLALALARKAPLLYNAMRRGVYERGLSAPIKAVHEMTLGLVGFGEIGREVAARARPFGFRLIASDPYVSAEAAALHGVTLLRLEELLAESDIVSVHAPLTKGTFHLLGERELALMNPAAYVVNTARGALIDQRALVAALEAGRLAGAGLDVFEGEPLEPDSPLLRMENVLLTPHVAGVSDSSQIAVKQRIARNIASVLTGEWTPTRDLVNPEVRGHPRQRASG